MTTSTPVSQSSSSSALRAQPLQWLRAVLLLMVMVAIVVLPHYARLTRAASNRISEFIP